MPSLIRRSTSPSKSSSQNVKKSKTDRRQMAPTKTCATNVARASRCSEVEEVVGDSKHHEPTRTVCAKEPSFLGHVSENGSRKQTTTTTTTNPKQTSSAPSRRNHPSKGNGAGSKVFGCEQPSVYAYDLCRQSSSSSSAMIRTNRNMSDGNKASMIHTHLKEEEHSEVENESSDNDSYRPIIQTTKSMRSKNKFGETMTTNVKVDDSALIHRPQTRANEKKVTTRTKQGSRRSYYKSRIEIIDSDDETSKSSRSSSPPLRKSLRSSKFSGTMNDSKVKADVDGDDDDDDDLISSIELPEDSKKNHRDCKSSSNRRKISTNTTTYKSDESSLNSQMDQDDESYDEEAESSSVGSFHSWDEKSPSRVSRNNGIKRKAGTRTSSRRRVVYHDSPMLSASSSIASKESAKSSPTPSPSRRNGKSPSKRLKRSAKHPKVESQIQTPTSPRHDANISSGDNSASGESNTEEEEEEVVGLLPIHRIIASRTETIRTWHKVCQTMHTSEIMNGSRWSQEKKQDCNTEERFLVKWRDLSYLHCTWETESDLLLCENKKLYLGTFRRKSIGGLIFDEEERGDGEFMNPCLVEIDRIVEIDEEEMTSLKNKAKEAKALHGMIFDMDDPNYHSGAGRQFLVKWKNTPYSDLSYEFERDLIVYDVEYESHVKSFQERKKKPSKEEVRKARNESEKEKRRLYKIFGDRTSSTDEARDAMVKSYQTEISKRDYRNHGELRDYQVEGVSWLISNYINRRSSILADEMGLGKTIQCAAFLHELATSMKHRGPYLIVAPLSTLQHWYRELSVWTNLNTVIYHGSATDRDRIREFELVYEEDRPTTVRQNARYLAKCAAQMNPKYKETWMAHVILTTPDILVADDFSELTAIRWEVLILDEAHRLKNHRSKLACNLRDSKFQFNHSVLMTGTPIQNNMTELWALLNIVDPSNFEDLDHFLSKYEDMKSKEELDELHQNIEPYILRRLKEDVEKSVPPKEETLIEVELSTVQKQYYRALYEKNIKFLHRKRKKGYEKASLNNLAMQVRKCCCHPFLLNGVESDLRATEEKTSKSQIDEGDFIARSSGKLIFLDKLLPRLFENGHRVLIFSQFKIMLDILEDYLNARKRSFERIDGSITGAKRQRAIDRFQMADSSGKNSPSVMLLSTRAGGVGINLTAADTVILYDSDWNPQSDIQAQARCHRIGQTKDVKVYRLLSRKTYEMQMFHKSSLKLGLDQAILNRIENGQTRNNNMMTGDEIERLLRYGAFDLFKEDKDGLSEKESNEFVEQDLDTILARRSKVVVQENTGSNSKAAGGVFSKASFKVNKNGAMLDDIDIDDPRFWEKVIGKEVQDEEEIINSKRQRTKKNYSELEYDRKLNSELNEKRTFYESDHDDDGSVSIADLQSVDEEDSDSDDEKESISQVPLPLSKVSHQQKETTFRDESCSASSGLIIPAAIHPTTIHCNTAPHIQQPLHLQSRRFHTEMARAGMIPVSIPVRPLVGRYGVNHGASVNGQIRASIPQSAINSNVTVLGGPLSASGQQAARGTHTVSVTYNYDVQRQENLLLQSRHHFETNQRVPPCMYNGMRTRPVVQTASTVQRDEGIRLQMAITVQREEARRITVQREEALRIEREKYLAMLSSTPLSDILQDLQGNAKSNV